MPEYMAPGIVIEETSVNSKKCPPVMSPARISPRKSAKELEHYRKELEDRIIQCTDWVAFEPNRGETWSQVRQVISDFLYAEWLAGGLVGTSSDHAYFVKCNRENMTQHDIDNGLLVVEIGIAIQKPSEFIIFRVAKPTADAHG